MIEVNEFLRDALVNHGLKAQIQAGWVTVEGRNEALRGRSNVFSTHPNGTAARLDVQVALPDGRLLNESFACIGVDHDAATKAALAKFAMNSLHVLLAAFLGRETDQVTREEWDIGGTKWKAFVGCFGVEARPNAGESPSEAVAQLKLPAGLMEKIRALVATRKPNANSVHWLRVFHGHVDGRTETMEVLWDNEEWHEAQRALGALEWPSGRSYFSVRNFLVVTNGTQDSRPRRDFRSLEEGVRILVDACASTPTIEVEGLLGLLEAAGFEEDVADRILVFTPLGFSNVLLHECKLPTDYEVMASDNRIVARRRLVSEPVFLAARDLAFTLANDPASRETFLRVAMRCSLAQGANDLLNADSKLEDLEFSAPIVFLSQFQPTAADAAALGSPAATTTSTSTSAATTATFAVAPTPTRDRRPWWRFW